MNWAIVSSAPRNTKSMSATLMIAQSLFSCTNAPLVTDWCFQSWDSGPTVNPLPAAKKLPSPEPDPLNCSPHSPHLKQAEILVICFEHNSWSTVSVLETPILYKWRVGAAEDGLSHHWSGRYGFDNRWHQLLSTCSVKPRRHLLQIGISNPQSIPQLSKSTVFPAALWGLSCDTVGRLELYIYRYWSVVMNITVGPLSQYWKHQFYTSAVLARQKMDLARPIMEWKL